MKLTNVFLASMLAVSSASTAFAASTGSYDVVLRVTGSTAFRRSTAQAIENIIVSNKRIGYRSGSGVTGHLNAGRAVYTGTLSNGKTVLIQTSWSGSEAGFKSIAATSPVAITNWLDDTNIASAAVGSSTAVAVDTTNDSAVANVAMADNAQNESLQKGTGYITLTSHQVGVVPFVWVRGTSANAEVQSYLNAFTNITSQQAQGVFNTALNLKNWAYGVDTAGKTVLPENIYVYAVGRDNLSGTRLNALLETYAAAKNAITQSITQVTPVTNTTNLTGYTVNANVASGLTSGGTLVQSLGKPAVNTIVDSVFVGYAGIADVTAGNYPGTGINGDGSFSWSGTGTNPVLSYNGVAYSKPAVLNGTYTFWGYEYIAYGSAITGNVNAQDAVNLLETEIVTNTADQAGIKLSEMQSQRTGAGTFPYSI